jgi:hypothetical protein
MEACDVVSTVNVFAVVDVCSFIIGCCFVCPRCEQRLRNSQATQNESKSESKTMELTPPPLSPLLDDASAKEMSAILEEFDSIPNLEDLPARAKPIQPPPHIVEAMVLMGDFDLDLPDLVLAPLFKDPPES